MWITFYKPVHGSVAVEGEGSRCALLRPSRGTFQDHGTQDAQSTDGPRDYPHQHLPIRQRESAKQFAATKKPALKKATDVAMGMASRSGCRSTVAIMSAPYRREMVPSPEAGAGVSRCLTLKQPMTARWVVRTAELLLFRFVVQIKSKLSLRKWVSADACGIPDECRMCCVLDHQGAGPTGPRSRWQRLSCLVAKYRRDWWIGAAAEIPRRGALAWRAHGAASMD